MKTEFEKKITTLEQENSTCRLQLQKYEEELSEKRGQDMSEMVVLRADLEVRLADWTEYSLIIAVIGKN